jgi:ribonuclease HII
LAGPVVAAAVVLPRKVDLPGLNDSKKLSADARERLSASIRQQAVAFSVAEVDPADIDRLNIYHAGLEAMYRAVVGLDPEPGHVLVDARTVPRISQDQTALVGGDAIDGSIAAASILAKVHRDQLMRAFDLRYPGYGLGRHMGYPTPEHLRALQRLGPSPIHRRSFAPVWQALTAGSRT